MRSEEESEAFLSRAPWRCLLSISLFVHLCFLNPEIRIAFGFEIAHLANVLLSICINR